VPSGQIFVVKICGQNLWPNFAERSQAALSERSGAARARGQKRVKIGHKVVKRGQTVKKGSKSGQTVWSNGGQTGGRTAAKRRSKRGGIVVKRCGQTAVNGYIAVKQGPNSGQIMVKKWSKDERGCDS
jgi:hypothetical protein